MTVKEFPETTVTRTISALDAIGATPAGHTVQLKGAAGNKVPSFTRMVVPARPGALVTVDRAKLACGSKLITASHTGPPGSGKHWPGTASTGNSPLY